MGGQTSPSVPTATPGAANTAGLPVLTVPAGGTGTAPGVATAGPYPANPFDNNDPTSPGFNATYSPNSSQGGNGLQHVPDSTKKPASGMDAGTIAFIIVGVVAFIMIVAGLCLYRWHKRRKQEAAMKKTLVSRSPSMISNPVVLPPEAYPRHNYGAHQFAVGPSLTPMSAAPAVRGMASTPMSPVMRHQEPSPFQKIEPMERAADMPVAQVRSLNEIKPVQQMQQTKTENALPALPPAPPVTEMYDSDGDNTPLGGLNIGQQVFIAHPPHQWHPHYAPQQRKPDA
ncbi:hypothetical protein HK101_005980 [Irineochytrium annulatum]|nr:hypothetical protein HK101_005980 [Irineochytrium annulatum]